MNIVLEDIAPCRKRIKIEVPANRVNEELEKITNSFQKHATVPGFRTGKTPKAIIEKRFGQDIEEELKRSFVPQILREAIRSKSLKVISIPRIEDLHYQRGMSLSFSTMVDLAPEFALPDYKSIRVTKIESDPVTEEKINEVVEGMKSRFAEYRPIEGREIKEGDYVVMDYTATMDGKPLSEFTKASELCEKKNFWLLMKPDSFIPGFAQQLYGAKIGETHDVKVTFPEDFDELKDKEAVYSVTVREMKEQILPEINEEFTQKNLKVSLEEFRQKISADLEQHQQRETDKKYRRDVINQLLNKANFDLPESLVRHQTQRLINDIVTENQYMGISEQVLEENKEKIFNSASTNAKEHVKLGFILNRIAEVEKIEVTHEEINRELHIMAHHYQMTPQKLVEEIQKNHGLAEIEEQILNRKTMDFLLKQAMPA